MSIISASASRTSTQLRIVWLLTYVLIVNKYIELNWLPSVIPNVTAITLYHELRVSAPRPTVAVERMLYFLNASLLCYSSFVLRDNSSGVSLATNVSASAEFASNCHSLVVEANL